MAYTDSLGLQYLDVRLLTVFKISAECTVISVWCGRSSAALTRRASSAQYL